MAGTPGTPRRPTSSPATCPRPETWTPSRWSTAPPYCTGTYWDGIIRPFTVASCIATYYCAHKLYSGTCLTKLQAIYACLGAVTSHAECQSKCASLSWDMFLNCSFPFSCGVNYPYDGGPDGASDAGPG